MRPLAVALLLLRGGTTLAFTVGYLSRITTKNGGLVTLNDKKKNAGDDDDDMSKQEVIVEYRNVATQFLGNFMQDKDNVAASSSTDSNTQEASDPLSDIDWNAPKLKPGTMDIETLAAVLDAELYEKEWFVTGRVNPIYFADSFRFEDPDVKLDGIEAYARGVYKLFDQQTSRAEVISTKVSTEAPNNNNNNMITCTWRLSGKVSIGPAGLTIKPYIVYTDFTVDPNTGLIILQQDRFDLPQWDILLSALFPFLIGKVRCYKSWIFLSLVSSIQEEYISSVHANKLHIEFSTWLTFVIFLFPSLAYRTFISVTYTTQITAPPAPPVEPRVVVMPKIRKAATAAAASGNKKNFFSSFFGGQ